MPEAAFFAALTTALTAALGTNLQARRRERAADAAADAAELAADAALRYVHVRSWEGHASAPVKLQRTFGAFFAEALAGVRAFGAARLYTLEGGDWQRRRPLAEGAPYAALLALAESPDAALPDILVFELQPGAETLPQAPPTAEAQGSDAPGAAGEGDTLSSARSSQAQEAFRLSLFARDGAGAACAVCAGEPVEAAHILPRTTSIEKLFPAHLAKADAVQNGILLCRDCHTAHDVFLWHYLRIVVAEALLQDAVRGAQWHARAGRQLTMPTAEQMVQLGWWPPESVWEVAFADFVSAQAERSARAAVYAFSCARCGWRGKSEKGLTGHACSRTRGALLFTPLGRGRRAAMGADAAGGAQ